MCIVVLLADLPVALVLAVQPADGVRVAAGGQTGPGGGASSQDGGPPPQHQHVQGD